MNGFLLPLLLKYQCVPLKFQMDNLIAAFQEPVLHVITSPVIRVLNGAR